MKDRATEEQFQSGFIPLAGRQDELRALTSALRQRRTHLVTGASGMGKTRLVEEALTASGQPSVFVRRPRVLHQLLVDLAQELSCRASRFTDVRHATSIVLKPLVLEALRVHPRYVVLEDVADADAKMYRFLQQVNYIPSVCLLVTAKSRDSLGHLRKLLWDPREEVALRPLHRAEALALFRSASSAFRLDDLDLEDFRAKVLASARGNPGQIVTMCRMATRREYQSGRHIKFLPLRMDALAAFV